MTVRQAELLATAVSAGQYPAGGLPEIALAGRSNVGKSSLINLMVNRKNLARTSGAPGKTRTLNFYLVDQSWFFVDLPGYGYAKVSKEERARWGKFIESYLNGRRQLAGVIQLVDLRHPPMESDRDMGDWLRQSGLPFLVAGTKADKIAKGRQAGQLRVLRQGLALPAAVPALAFSSLTGQGREELALWLEERTGRGSAADA